VFERGDIVWAHWPPPAGKVCHEQLGRRPAIVVQDEPRLSALPTAILVPITSQKKTLRFPGTFLIRPTITNGLTQESVALAFQIVAIDKSRIEKTVGKLSSEDFSSLESLILDLLGFIAFIS
jgi:mRNA interferase MazF